MDIKRMSEKVVNALGKYRYAALILLIGIGLMLIPGKSNKGNQTVVENTTVESQHKIDEEVLSQILQAVDGAGRVQVMLSVSSGEETIFKTNIDENSDGENISKKVETVIVSDSDRGEYGLIQQTNPPVYLGAIVVCEGADSAAVRLAITQAVAKITGLGTDSICVLKMK